MKSRTISEIMADARPSSLTKHERMLLEAELERAKAYVGRLETMLGLNASSGQPNMSRTITVI